MKKENNPFIVSGKIPAAYFCDRKDESIQLAHFLTSGENVVLMSQRRMGKTQLVNHCFESEKLTDAYLIISIDILHTTSFREFIQTFGAEVFDMVAKKNARLMKLFTSTMRSLSACFGYDPVHNTPTFDIRLGDIHSPEYTLKEIFQYLENAGKPCLVVIDEFQQITKYPERNVEALLRTHIQQINNAHFVFSGSQRRLMEEMFFSEKRPFFMSSRSIVLNPIDLDDYCNFATKLFKRADKDIEPSAIQLVYERFHGVTLYLQRIMKDAFSTTSPGDTCTVANVTHLIDSYVLECEPRLREQLAFVSETQKELLYAIGSESKAVPSITSSTFIQHHRLKSPSAAQAAAKKLLEYDLITRQDGKYTISDPLMLIWLNSRRF